MTFRKIALSLGGVIAGGLLAFVGVNAVDWFRYHHAIWRMEHLNQAQCLALGDPARSVTSHMRADGLTGFEDLHAISANLSPGSSDFLLYELRSESARFGDDYVFLYARISTSPSNQTIQYFTNSDGGQRSRVVWNRNPDFAKKVSPGNRILTVRQWNGESRSWIVLKDRIMVVDDFGYVGSEAKIVATLPLNEAGLARIKETLSRLPANALGKNYGLDGVADGLHLHILFEPDGEEGPSDVNLSNIWIEEFRPLLTAISELGPNESPIGYIESITHDNALKGQTSSVRTLKESKIFYDERPTTPWWCVWRSLIN